MQATHIHDFRCNDVGTIALSSGGITTSLHQQGLLLLAIQLFIPLQNGHDFWLMVFCIDKYLLDSISKWLCISVISCISCITF